MNDLELHPVLIKAREGWGPDIPDWVLGLARACAESSQNKVAKRMAYSAATISQVVAGKYPGDLGRVRDVYLGIFEAALADCPELGSIPLDRCREWRRRATSLRSGNAMNVRMFRACNRCPINRAAAEEASNV